MKGWLSAVVLLFAASPAFAQTGPAVTQGASASYVLGAEDVISVSVWLNPELNRSVVVQMDGNITFPPIGQIPAAGQTLKQLGDRIAERLSTYLRQTATITVSVVEFNSRSVFVTGAVARPGRYGFENLPGILDVLDHAGGATALADLSLVQILRPEGRSRNVIEVDVAAALRLGPAAALPELKPGDTIVVPTLQTGNLSPGAGVGVLGAVTRPGVYGVGQGQELWAVLAAAGGMTTEGDLRKVRIIRVQNDRQAVTTLDLRTVLGSGGAVPYMLQPGDVVFVEPRGHFWSGAGAILGAVYAAGLVVLGASLSR